MMDNSLGRMERLVLAFDAPPLDLLYRAAVGYVVMPAYQWLGSPWMDRGTQPYAWALFGTLLVVLAASRVAPLVLRVGLPFPRAIKNAWAERRQLAKHADSYQWRKMLGVGLGWAAWCLQARLPPGAVPFIGALACVASGVLGWVAWWSRSVHKVPTDQPAQVH
jgi:hypothetical protein